MMHESVYPSYTAYKGSGVVWLGEVPEHWEVKRLRFLCGISNGSRDTVNAEENGVYPFFVRSQTIERISTYAFDGEAVLTPGDGAGVGKVFHYYVGKFDYHERVYMLSKFKRVNGKFLYYFLKENFYKVVLEGSAKSTVDSLRLRMFQNFEISVPVISEQKQVSCFLDRETAKIDTLIEKQERLVTLLTEKRQAVISHAVTKGLNPNAPMKDSGIEWLGEVPEDWEVIRLKYSLTDSKPGPFGSAITKDMYVSDGYRIYGQEHVIPNNFNTGNYFINQDAFNELKQYSVKPGDILISCVGTFGKIAIVPDCIHPGIINPRLIRLRCNCRAAPNYISTLLASDVVHEQLSFHSRGGTLDFINIKILNNIVVVLPPIKEQQALLLYIDVETYKIDKLIEKAKQSIELMKERRSALIFAAVTGKIDVREVA